MAMIICDFSSIFELAAGLNAAFVVVEYSRSFSKQLYENVFNFDLHIDKNISVSRTLIDDETLIGLESVKCGESDTGKLIEKIRRDKEKLNSFIEEERKRLKASAKDACELRSHSGLSLLNFLFCLFILFLSPFENFHATITQYLIITALFIILFVQMICWIADARDKSIKLFNSLSLSISQSFFVFLIDFVISIIAYCILQHLSIYWKLEQHTFLFVMYLAALLPFLNFVVFTFILKNKLKQVQNNIRQIKDIVLRWCNDINALANKVNTVSEVSHMLELTE